MRYSRPIRNIAEAAKWGLIALNLVLFCVSLHGAANIALVAGQYLLRSQSSNPIYVNQWVFMAECAVAAAVFATVTWRPLARPAGPWSLALLVTAPIAFFLIFGPLVGNMV